MINFKKDIENFSQNDLKEDVVLSLMDGKTSLAQVGEKHNKTRSYISLVAISFLEGIYNNHKEFFDKKISKIKEDKVVYLDDVASKYKRLGIHVLERVMRNDANIKNIIFSEDTGAILQSSFYADIIEHIQSEELPLEISEIADDLNSSEDDILTAVTHYSKTNAVYFDENTIYSFRQSAFRLVDSIAETVSANLQELYEELKKNVRKLPKGTESYEKFVGLVNKRTQTKERSERINNILRIDKGTESLVTKKRAYEIFELKDEIVDEIIKESIEQAKQIECLTDSKFLLDAVSKKIPHAKKLNPYILKSLLIDSGEFEQGRKFNVILKDADCVFKTIPELVKMAFEKTGNKYMTINNIFDAITSNGRAVTKTHLSNIVQKHFTKVEGKGKKALYSL